MSEAFWVLASQVWVLEPPLGQHLQTYASQPRHVDELLPSSYFEALLALRILFWP